MPDAVPVPPEADRCCYHENNRHCTDTGVYVVQFGGRENTLCARHARPEFHPPDLHKKLPGRLARAVRRIAQ